MSKDKSKKQSETETLLDKIFKVSTMADIEKYKEDLESINEKMLEKIIPTLDYANLLEHIKVLLAAGIYLDSRAIIGTLKKELTENPDLAKLYINILCCTSEVTTVDSDRYIADTDAVHEDCAAGTVIASPHEHKPNIGTLWGDVFDTLTIPNTIKAVGDLLETVYRFIPNQVIGFCIRKIYEKLPDDDFDECRNAVKKIGAKAYYFTPEDAFCINNDMEDLEEKVNKYGSNYGKANVKLYHALFLVNAENCGVRSIEISRDEIRQYLLAAENGNCEFAENTFFQDYRDDREYLDNGYCGGDYEPLSEFTTYDDDDFGDDIIDIDKKHKSWKCKNKKRKSQKERKKRFKNKSDNQRMNSETIREDDYKMPLILCTKDMLRQSGYDEPFV